MTSRELESRASGDTNPLEHRVGSALGMELKSFRQKLGLTVQALAEKAGISAGSLSKMENGIVLPSIATLVTLADALLIPVTVLLRRFDQESSIAFVKSGHGLNMERRGTRAGHQYQLLGHSVGKRQIAVEPYMCTLTAESEVYPIFQHPGMEFMFMLEGEMNYRHGARNFKIAPGDSMFFGSDVPHGPEELVRVPIRFVAVMVHSSSSE